jgi:hypothetical protein
VSGGAWKMVPIGKGRSVDHAFPADTPIGPGPGDVPAVYGAACGGRPSGTLLTWAGRLVCIGCARAVLMLGL